jgi:hypothetical protein
MVVAVVGSVLATLVQKYVVGDLASGISVVDYGTVNPVWFGMAVGTGATLDELPNSFVKRRLGIAPGGTQRGALGVLFWVWDQVDLLTGAWPLLLPWVRPTTSLVLASIAIVLLLHPLVALVGYLTGARKSAR